MNSILLTEIYSITAFPAFSLFSSNPKAHPFSEIPKTTSTKASHVFNMPSSGTRQVHKVQYFNSLEYLKTLVIGSFISGHAELDVYCLKNKTCEVLFTFRMLLGKKYIIFY